MKKCVKTLTAILTAASVITGLLSIPALAGEDDDYGPNNEPVVTVEQGKLEGFMNGDTFTFLGVPYAQAERFEEPQKPDSWEGIRKARAYGKTCLIPTQTEVGNDEAYWPHRYWIQGDDCQNLNIWTQTLDTEAKKPVMVFLHGGGYTNGSSIESAAYDGANLSDYANVVVVTLNHRLNALGFLDLSAYGGDLSGASNLGVKDLVAALQWIQDNIEQFGGDPENVTIFGQSGGGSKVLTLMHTPAAEGLFQKGICESGYLAPVSKEDAQNAAAATLEKLGISEDNAGEIKNVDYQDLLNAAAEAGASWNPEVDEDYILSDYCDWAKDIPLMAGTVFSEFNYNWMIQGDKSKNEWTDEEAMSRLTEKYGSFAQSIADEFRKVFPDKPLADAYFYDGYANFGICRNGVEEICSDKAAVSEAPTYEYLFSYEANVDGGIMAFHCSDLIYAFHNVDIPVVKLAVGGDGAAYQMQDTVASAWAAFAKNGDPSTDSLVWKPYTDDEKNITILDKNSETRILGDEHLIDLMRQGMEEVAETQTEAATE